jgi:hypothetical protein
VNILTQYFQEKVPGTSMADISEKDWDNLLSEFYAGLRKMNGEKAKKIPTIAFVPA